MVYTCCSKSKNNYRFCLLLEFIERSGGDEHVVHIVGRWKDSIADLTHNRINSPFMGCNYRPGTCLHVRRKFDANSVR